MKKWIIGFAALLLAAQAHAQDANTRLLAQFLDGETVGHNQSAADVNVALLIRYVGTSANGKVAVEADGNLTLIHGAVGSEAADTSLECPVSGALGGVIDVSDTACNTLGEVVDVINGSSNGAWKAVILAGLRSDSSNDTLNALTSTAAMDVNGLGLVWDTNVANTVTVAVTNLQSLRDYVGGDNKLLPRPFDPFRAVVYEVNYSINHGTAAPLLFYSVDVTNRESGGAETVTTLYSQTAVDTTETLFDRKPFGIMGKKGQKLLLRFTDGGTMGTVALVSARGTEFRHK